MRLRISRPALREAFQRQGKDIEQVSHQEMRSLVCAQCHVEYYFKGKGNYLTFPWDKGDARRRRWSVLRRDRLRRFHQRDQQDADGQDPASRLRGLSHGHSRLSRTSPAPIATCRIAPRAA